MKNKGILLMVMALAILVSCKKEKPAVAPVVSISEMVDISGTTATLKIQIINNGGALITEQGICWNTTQCPTINDHKRAISEANGFTGSDRQVKSGVVSETISISSENSVITISDLMPNKTYYFRAYAINTAGVGYSEESEITTLTLTPALTTLYLSAVTSDSARGGGNITDDGGADITARGLCWSTNQNPTIVDNKTTDGSGTGNFTSMITGLSPATKYFVRAYATNSIGTNYGNEVSITTPGVLPSVTTKTMEGVYTYSAITGGIITNNGGVSVSSCGVAWSTNPSPTINDHFISHWITENFSITITGLNPGTNYYLRAYAENNVGIAYGDQISFRTNDAVLPTEDYLPLQVGNYWELNNGTSTHTLFVDQLENLDGKEYYRVIRTGGTISSARDTVYFRKTAEGKVYQRGTQSDDEILRFDFSASRGDTWYYPVDPALSAKTNTRCSPWTEKLVSKTDTVVRNNRTFIDIYKFNYYYAGAGDAPMWDYWLAPGIGFVKYWYGDYTFYPIRRLTKVRINGVEQVF